MVSNISKSYSKIAILMIIGDVATTKLEFLNAKLTLSGNHIIVTESDSEDSETNRVFDLSEIAAYKTYNKITSK